MESRVGRNLCMPKRILSHNFDLSLYLSLSLSLNTEAILFSTSQSLPLFLPMQGFSDKLELANRFSPLLQR